MFTQEQADYLLALQKETDKGLVVDLSLPKIRFALKSPDDDEWEFIVDISNSRKKIFKISLHHMETRAKEGLLRVDFNGSHRNPETTSNTVPEVCKPFVGRWFQNEPHIHIFVEGFRDLAWAIPLSDYNNFDVKLVESSGDFASAIKEFTRRINVTTPYQIQEAIL
jgi:hypothetical protein